MNLRGLKMHFRKSYLHLRSLNLHLRILKVHLSTVNIHLQEPAPLPVSLSPQFPNVASESIPVKTTPHEHAWPWVPYQKVKICLFNEKGWQPYLVNFGEINSSITKSIELTPDQQKRVWTAFTADP